MPNRPDRPDRPPKTAQQNKLKYSFSSVQWGGGSMHDGGVVGSGKVPLGQSREMSSTHGGRKVQTSYTACLSYAGQISLPCYDFSPTLADFPSPL